MEQIICGSCGAALVSACRFCPRCGTGVPKDGVVPKAMQATQPARRLGPNAVQCGTCGTQMVADVAYCFACGVPVSLPEGNEAPAARMREAEAEPPRRRSRVAQVLIVIGIISLGGFGACVACVIYGTTKVLRHAPEIMINQEAQYRSLVPPALAKLMPGDEASFCTTLDAYSQQAKDAGGPNAPPATLTRLISERDPKLTLRTFSGWVGVPIIVSSGGGVTMDVQLPCDARMTNMGFMLHPRQENGITRRTYAIPEDSPVAKSVLALGRLQPIRFGGAAVPDENGQPRMHATQDATRLMAPVFVVEFTAVAPAEAGSGE